jgi:hypothetical protein
MLAGGYFLPAMNPQLRLQNAKMDQTRIENGYSIVNAYARL